MLIVIIVTSAALSVLLGYFCGAVSNTEALTNYVKKELEKRVFCRVKLNKEHIMYLLDENPFKEDSYLLATPVEIRGEYLKLKFVSGVGKEAERYMDPTMPRMLLERLEDDTYSCKIKYFNEHFEINKRSRSNKLDNI